MQKNLLVVYTDGTTEAKKVVGSELKFLQQIVGGYIETITTRQYIFIVNEDGIAMELKPNKAATAICKADGGRIGNNLLLGNVAIMANMRRDEVNMHGLKDEQISILKELAGTVKV